MNPGRPRADLRIDLLGGFRVAAGETTVGEAAWRLRKARGLVKLLALTPEHSLHREQAIEALWPDLEPAAASNNLRQALFVARRALDSCGEDGAARITLAHDVLTLATDGLRIDVEAFEAARRRPSGPRASSATVLRSISTVASFCRRIGSRCGRPSRRRGAAGAPPHPAGRSRSSVLEQAGRPPSGDRRASAGAPRRAVCMSESTASSCALRHHRAPPARAGPVPPAARVTAARTRGRARRRNPPPLPGHPHPKAGRRRT